MGQISYFPHPFPYGHTIDKCISEKIRDKVARTGVNFIATGQSTLKTAEGKNAGN